MPTQQRPVSQKGNACRLILVATPLPFYSPFFDVASEAFTTSRYSLKSSLARTGALVATEPITVSGYFSRSQAARAPGIAC